MTVLGLGKKAWFLRVYFLLIIQCINEIVFKRFFLNDHFRTEKKSMVFKVLLSQNHIKETVFKSKF